MSSANIEQAIYTDLVASTAVHDVIGNRVFFLTADQNVTLPYCTYSVVSDPHTPMAFDASDTGQARIQLNIVDDDKYTALTAAEAVRDRLDKYSTSMDGVTIYTLNCSGIIMFPLPEQENVFRATFDALVRYKDA